MNNVENVVSPIRSAPPTLFVKKRIWNCGFLEILEISKNKKKQLFWEARSIRIQALSYNKTKILLKTIDFFMNNVWFLVCPNRSASPTLFVKNWNGGLLTILKISKLKNINCLRSPKYENISNVLLNHFLKIDWLVDE